MVDTVESLNLELTRLQNALAALINGERVTEFIIGSGSTQRRYRYEEISETFLQDEISRVKKELALLVGETQTFRATSVMQTMYRKL